MVRVRVASDYPKGHVLIRALFELARRGNSDAVGVQQQRHHHPPMVALIPAQLALLPRINLREVEFTDGIEHKPTQIPFRQPLQRRRRQQKTLRRLVGT